MAKARKPKANSQFTWRVNRTNDKSVAITAEALTLSEGDLVFTTNGVPVRVIAADTYTDVELVVAEGG